MIKESMATAMDNKNEEISVLEEMSVFFHST